MILLLAYSAVLLSFLSGLLGLLMHQRQHLLEFSLLWFKKFPNANAQWLDSWLEEKRFRLYYGERCLFCLAYPVFLRYWRD